LDHKKWEKEPWWLLPDLLAHAPMQHGYLWLSTFMMKVMNGGIFVAFGFFAVVKMICIAHKITCVMSYIYFLPKVFNSPNK